MNLDILDSLLRGAVDKAYRFCSTYSTECDFKYEMFHQCGLLDFDGIGLAEKVPGTPTCRLHAEARPECRNPSKADLVICNPHIPKQPFNYQVEIIVELKKALALKDLRDELQKFDNYKIKPKRLYIVSANAASLRAAAIDDEVLRSGLDNVRIIIPDVTTRTGVLPSSLSNEATAVSTEVIISESISETLRLYGQGRSQYHGFFWCNYEHEMEKRWTFPVEGDFNCQLYHKLRIKLPHTVAIRAEANPRGLRERVDFFISDKNSDAQFTLEIKMNWDQFKPKYDKSRALRRSEAETIKHKFAHHGKQYLKNRNILVVIQGVEAHKSNHKANALKSFANGEVPLDLFYFDEKKNCVVHEPWPLTSLKV